MKSTILKTLAGIAGCFFLLSATHITGSAPKKFKAHTAYWYVKSGDEFIEVKKAVIPESALTKDNNGKLTAVDENVINNKVQFKNQKNYNGRKVDAQFVILSDSEDENATGSMVQHLQSGKKGTNSPLFCVTMIAYYRCWNGIVPMNCGTGNDYRWSCNWAGTDMCLVWSLVSGNYYYITYHSATY